MNISKIQSTQQNKQQNPSFRAIRGEFSLFGLGKETTSIINNAAKSGNFAYGTNGNKTFSYIMTKFNSKLEKKLAQILTAENPNQVLTVNSRVARTDIKDFSELYPYQKQPQIMTIG